LIVQEDEYLLELLHLVAVVWYDAMWPFSLNVPLNYSHALSNVAGPWRAHRKFYLPYQHLNKHGSKSICTVSCNQIYYLRKIIENKYIVSSKKNVWLGWPGHHSVSVTCIRQSSSKLVFLKLRLLAADVLEAMLEAFELSEKSSKTEYTYP
jgi:hypothetical protein